MSVFSYPKQCLIYIENTRSVNLQQDKLDKNKNKRPSTSTNPSNALMKAMKVMRVIYGPNGQIRLQRVVELVCQMDRGRSMINQESLLIKKSKKKVIKNTKTMIYVSS